MTKKEKVEDINVMEGIDFETNQKRLRELEQRKKERKRKQTIFNVIFVVLVIMILFIIMDRMRTKAIESCMELGQSREWCEVHTQ
jgi:uncharacterized integral membrane protein